jgi:hypothetical protein
VGVRQVRRWGGVCRIDGWLGVWRDVYGAVITRTLAGGSFAVVVVDDADLAAGDFLALRAQMRDPRLGGKESEWGQRLRVLWWSVRCKD